MSTRTLVLHREIYTKWEKNGTQLGNKLILNKKKWQSISKQISTKSEKMVLNWETTYYQLRKNGTQKGNEYQMRKIGAHEENMY